MPSMKLTNSIELFQEENEFIVKQHVKGSLQTELQQRIREGLLDDILPFLSIKQIMMNEYIVEILMPYPYVGTVLEMVAKQEIAKTESEFKNLLYQIASMMNTYHQSKALAGEIRASQLFVEKVSNGDLKVHPIFFSSMNTLADKRSSVQIISLENQVLMERAAPEIRDNCFYSQASDVYSFGVLIWDLAEARSGDGCPFPGTALAVNHSSAGWEEELEIKRTLNSPAIPRHMDGNILKIMRLCLQPDARNRPTMEEICWLLSSEVTEDGYPMSETSDYSTLPGSEIKDSASDLEVDPPVSSNEECLPKVLNPSSIFSQSDRATVADSGIFSIEERKVKYGSIQDMFKSHQSLACNGPPYAEYLTLDSMHPPEDDAHSLSEHTDTYHNIDPESVQSSTFSNASCESVRCDSPVDQSPPRLPPRNLHFFPFLKFNTSGLTDSVAGNAIYEVIGEPTLQERCVSLNLVSVDHNEA
ncbi:unnamed protein product [Lymnaea stagnalis]|uniref:Protein kinase domain-containing protein n=1 Tax=Lymnaea stagnalis TaxID=6523 RepID=A0AAV2HUN3_LYMST